MSLTVDVEPGLQALGLDQRLRDAPASARVRGLFFRLAEQALAERESELLTSWRALTGARSRWPFKLYSLRDFLREQAIAAVLLNPADPGVALHDMWTTTPRLSSLMRADGFIRYLAGRDPVAALVWLEKNRKMMCSYGAWHVEILGPRSAVMHHHDEYVWIETCHVGGCEGTLARCGVTPKVTVELDSPYDGRLRISWSETP